MKLGALGSRNGFDSMFVLSTPHQWFHLHSPSVITHDAFSNTAAHGNSYPPMSCWAICYQSLKTDSGGATPPSFVEYEYLHLLIDQNITNPFFFRTHKPLGVIGGVGRAHRLQCSILSGCASCCRGSGVEGGLPTKEVLPCHLTLITTQSPCATLCFVDFGYALYACVSG